eukprot:SAG31_NODE_15391_length_757_cov_1.484802_1_plen_57_part_10
MEAKEQMRRESRRHVKDLVRKDCHPLDFVGLFLLNLPYTHREIDCLLSRSHGTDRES